MFVMLFHIFRTGSSFFPSSHWIDKISSPGLKALYSIFMVLMLIFSSYSGQKY